MTIKEVTQPYPFNDRSDQKKWYTYDDENNEHIIRYKREDVVRDVLRQHHLLRDIHDPSYSGNPGHPLTIWTGAGSLYLTHHMMQKKGIVMPGAPSESEKHDWLLSMNTFHRTSYDNMDHYGQAMDASLRLTRPLPQSAIFYSGISPFHSRRISETYRVGQPNVTETHIAMSINPEVAAEHGNHIAEISVPAYTKHVTYVGAKSTLPEQEAILRRNTPVIYMGTSTRMDTSIPSKIHHFQVTTLG